MATYYLDRTKRFSAGCDLCDDNALNQCSAGKRWVKRDSCFGDGSSDFRSREYRKTGRQQQRETENQATNRSFHWTDSLNGLTHLTSGNRAKSPSVETAARPCSIANAAKWVSGIRFAPPAACVSSRPKIAACPSAGCGIQTLGEASHFSTCAHAARTESGRSKIRELVAIRKNPNRLCQGRPTRGRSFKRPSSHSRAAACWGRVVMRAYTSRFVSTRIT